jgi:hypothetical protein
MACTTGGPESLIQVFVLQGEWTQTSDRRHFLAEFGQIHTCVALEADDSFCAAWQQIWHAVNDSTDSRIGDPKIHEL